MMKQIVVMKNDQRRSKSIYHSSLQPRLSKRKDGMGTSREHGNQSTGTARTAVDTRDGAVAERIHKSNWIYGMESHDRNRISAWQVVFNRPFRTVARRSCQPLDATAKTAKGGRRMNDIISRQAGIDVVHKIIYGFFDLADDDSEEPISDKDKLLLEVNKAICEGIKDLVSAQPSFSQPHENDHSAEVGKKVEQSEPCEYYALCRHGRDENNLRANLGVCDYCHEDSDGYVNPIEKNSHAFIRFGMNGWELSLKANGWHGSAKIRYCPMCGRRLGDG